MTITLNS